MKSKKLEEHILTTTRRHDRSLMKTLEENGVKQISDEQLAMLRISDELSELREEMRLILLLDNRFDLPNKNLTKDTQETIRLLLLEYKRISGSYDEQLKGIREEKTTLV